ncbi:MAG TPA: hypothetical protein VGM90_34260 [Kofleriaceae bacterium]
MRRIACLVILIAATANADNRPFDHGYTVTVGGGLNVSAPYLEAQVGRRFERAPFFELYLDYSYGWPISELSFQTFGIGERSYFFHRPRVEVFHQALMGFAISSSGTGKVQDRAIGERFLGAFVSQGLGTAVTIAPQWQLSLTLSSGYPVWLRSDLSLRYTF